MTKVYDYAKSSCNKPFNCYDCNKPFNPEGGVPTNMSIRGCSYSNFADCYEKQLFKLQQEPDDDCNSRKSCDRLNSPNILRLNESVYSDKTNNTYNAINSENCINSPCEGTTYFNSDPRLYNAAAGTWMQLDSPPVQVTNKIDSLNTDSSLDFYGQRYRSYADVNSGQILYYIDKEIENAFYKPIFSKKVTDIGFLYKDPMGNLKPEYNHVPNEKYDRINGDPCDVAGEYGLSWMKDTQYHREDLLAKQMWKQNQEKYSARWSNALF
jgi:hypothetical protein